MKIYLAGAHSSGKTTLARYISTKYNLPLITEVARSILAEEEMNLKELRVNLDLVDSYQEKIFQRQIQKEKELKNFVSDRSVDCLAYTAQHSRVLSKIVKSKEYEDYIESIKSKDSIIFYVKPCKETLAPDGVREELSWEGVIAIDSMIKYIFEQNDIPHIQINTSNMQERARIVDSILSKI